jgi:hypothetical protein
MSNPTVPAPDYATLDGIKHLVLGVDGTGTVQYFSLDNTGKLQVVVSSTPAPTGFTASDGSGTIATGGTAQNLFSGTIPTNGYAIYNPDATNDLWIYEGGTAVANGTGCIRVAANGGGYETPPNYKPYGIVSIVGAGTGQKFTGRKW